jgi:alpha-L-fucosidase
VNEKKDFVYFTKKGNDLFVICTHWSQKEFKIKGIEEMETTNISLSGYDGPVEWQKTENGITIQPPPLNPVSIPCDYAWGFQISDVLEGKF